MISTLKKKLSKKGFTLAELLVVVAIIAILVAIAIPVFTTQLEKSRDAVDAANVRAAYAEATAAYITETDGTAATYAYNIDGKSTDAKWEQTDDAKMTIAGVEVDMIATAKSVSVAFATDGSYTITLSATAVEDEGKQ